MQALTRSIVLFMAAGLCEIGGGWLVWQFWREGRGWLFGGLVRWRSCSTG